MKCSQCKQEIPEASKFCFHCGAKVVPTAEIIVKNEMIVHKLCPNCRAVYDAERVYCDRCGRLLRQRKIEGKELYKIQMASKYEGEPTVGIAKATGDLVIFDDRVEFRRKMGNAASAMFGAAGMLISAQKVPAVETFNMDEIGCIRIGKYAGLMPTLVIQLKDQRVFSFCGLADVNVIHKAAELIEEYRS